MNAKNPNPELVDEDNPEWTDEDFKNARPFYKVFPQFKPKAAKPAAKSKVQPKTAKRAPRIARAA